MFQFCLGFMIGAFVATKYDCAPLFNQLSVAVSSYVAPRNHSCEDSRFSFWRKKHS